MEVLCTDLNKCSNNSKGGEVEVLCTDLNKCSNNSEGGEAKVFKWPGLAGCLQERVQVQWDVSCQEVSPCLGMTCNTLKHLNKCSNITCI